MSQAFIVGHTGKTGRAICIELGKQKRFPRVVLFGRREVDTAEFGPEFECRVVDFKNLKPEDFQGFEQGFSALGATTAQGREGWRSIDRDAVLKVCELAKQGGCKHFHMVTSKGTSANSSFFALRMKHEAEEGARNLGFDQLSIYRPSMIIYPRSWNNFRLQLAQDLCRPFSSLSIRYEDVIGAMLKRTKAASSGVMVLEVQDMVHLAKEPDETPAGEGGQQTSQ